jgi:hypothetical protein
VDEKTARKTTEILIWSTIVVWIVWDVIVMVLWGAYPTESRTIADWSTRVGTMPLAWGVLGGHFFWNVPAGTTLWKYRHWVIVGVGALMMGTDTAMYFTGTVYPLGATAALPVAGFPIGHWFWPQHRKS